MWLEFFFGAVHEELHIKVTSAFREVNKSIPIRELLQDPLRQQTQDSVLQVPLNILDVLERRI